MFTCLQLLRCLLHAGLGLFQLLLEMTNVTLRLIRSLLRKNGGFVRFCLLLLDLCLQTFARRFECVTLCTLLCGVHELSLQGLSLACPHTFLALDRDFLEQGAQRQRIILLRSQRGLQPLCLLLTNLELARSLQDSGVRLLQLLLQVVDIVLGLSIALLRAELRCGSLCRGPCRRACLEAAHLAARSVPPGFLHCLAPWAAVGYEGRKPASAYLTGPALVHPSSAFGAVPDRPPGLFSRTGLFLHSEEGRSGR